MRDVRTGFGYDAHRLGGGGPIVLAGVTIDHPMGILATSDGDTATHALCDALLGALADGDLGTHFPSSDDRYVGVASSELLADCVDRVAAAGLEIGFVDVTIVVEEIRVAPHREAMRTSLAATLGIPVSRVSVKATTVDGMGWIGSGEGIAAHAVATLYA